MLTVVTGADGFVGQALARRMAAEGYAGTVRLVDRAPPPAAGGAFESVAADLVDPADLRRAIAGADRIVHLAALAGGAAEADPEQSRALNLDLPLALMAALRGSDTRLVLAGSIAVFGAPLPEEVDDATAPAPAMTYGAHKRMIEIAAADAVRRGDIDAVVVRLPGIVARPGPARGLKSAFLNELFWAVRDRRSLVLPVRPDATSWLMSADCCARNLLHALAVTARVPVLTLPALRVRIDRLVGEIARQCGTDAAGIGYAPEPAIQAQFGAYPALRTPAADALGFRHDGDLAGLVRAALGEAAAAAKEKIVEACH